MISVTQHAMEPDDHGPLISLRGVDRAFDTSGEPVRALSSVSFDIFAGEFVAIVGPSGSGKSTLLNILGLLDVPTDGTYLIDGVDVSTIDESQRDAFRSRTVGFVFQASHVILNATAAENAALGLRVQGVPLQERRNRVEVALRRLALSARASSQGRNLSGGERQRVAIARAIATNPKLLLADEPTGALDSINSESILNHFLALNRAGVTVVIITHDPKIAAFADRQLHLIDGKLTEERHSGNDPQITSAEAVDRTGVVELASPRVGRTSSTASTHRFGRLQSGAGRAIDETLEAVSHHTSTPGRAILLLFAFMLGTGGLVASLGISQSAAVQVSQRITAAGLDEVTVVPIGTTMESFTADAGRIRLLDGVEEVGLSAAVTAGDATLTTLEPGVIENQPHFGGSVMIADPGYLRAKNVTVSPANAADLLDNSWGGAVALLGTRAAAELGVEGIGVGQRVWIGGVPVDVAGLIESGGRDTGLQNGVVLSTPLLEQLEHGPVELLVRTEPGYPAPVAEAIPVTLSAGNPGAVRTSTVADLRLLRSGVASDLSSLIGIISVVLLALASLSAATAMYLSVRTRASEIALRRAIGSSRLSIWRMFTLEGAVIGAAGGIAGSAVGIAGILVAGILQGWAPVLDPVLALAGLTAGTLTGILSATYPALVAARANPADAIRG